MTEITERLCISCKWFRVIIQEHQWSDWTPGSPSYIGCAASLKTDKPFFERKDHCGFNPSNPDDNPNTNDTTDTDTTDYYRKMLLTAQTCLDYKKYDKD